MAELSRPRDLDPRFLLVLAASAYLSLLDQMSLDRDLQVVLGFFLCLEMFPFPQAFLYPWASTYFGLLRIETVLREYEGRDPRVWDVVIRLREG